MFSLDIPTQLLDVTLIRLGQTLAFFILWQIRRDYLPARDWAVGAGLSTLGLVSTLAFPRDQTDPLISILAFNIFALAGWLVFNAGVIRATGRAVPWKSALLIALIAWTGIGTTVTMIPTEVEWRLAFFHGATIIADLFTAYCCLKPAAGTRSRSLTFVAMALGLLVISSLLRVVLSTDSSVTSGLEPKFFNVQFLLVSIPLLVVTALLLTVQTLEAAQQELERQARRDALTQALNRRGFEELATREWARAKRNRQTVGLLTIDIDHFKQINDTLGHHMGDQVLEAISRRIQSLLRPEDLLGRMGGDEFLVMLAGSSPEQATAVAERIRGAVGELTDRNGDALPRVGISIGVTAVSVATQNPAQGWEDAMKAADAALYAAKRNGRDRVVRV